MSTFFKELKNRNVYKVATAYAITAWLLIQVVDTVGPNLGWPDAVENNLIKILVVGFPIALVLTWLYEFTPQGLKRTGKIQEETPDNRRAGRRLNRMIIGTLAILICFLLVERFFLAGYTTINERQKASIAVLPFINMSSDEKNAYFADGLTESILNKLAQLSGMQVTARSSAFQFIEKNKDIREIAKLLEVNYILEGSVQFDSRSNRIKITTQLINATNGYHLWSDTYEDYFEEIFDIQEKVSREVASQLQVKLLPREEQSLANKSTQNTEAYKLFLQAREYSQLRDETSLKKGIDLLEQAIELAPEYAEAHAELAFLYNQRHFYGILDKETRDENMKIHMEKALKLDPEKPEVLRAKTVYDLVMGNSDTTQRIEDLRKAITINPNYADGHYGLGMALNAAMQPKAALKYFAKTAELDPLNDFYRTQYLNMLFFLHRQHDKALDLVNQHLSKRPSDRLLTLKSRMLASAPYGDLAEAFKIRFQALNRDPNNRRLLTVTLRGAMELDLEPLAAKIVRSIQLNFSDPKVLSNQILLWYYYKQDYTKAREIIDYLDNEEKLDTKTIAFERSWISLMLGEVDKAQKIFEEAFTDVISDTTFEKIDFSNSEYYAYYGELLKANGRDEKADQIASHICEYYSERLKNFPLMSDHGKYQDKLVCYYLTDKDKFVSYLEDVFFEKKDRLDWYADLKSRFFVLFENDPQYRQLYSKIKAETHRMRAEVIKYLKEEGDWDPAWDKEIGLE